MNSARFEGQTRLRTTCSHLSHSCRSAGSDFDPALSQCESAPEPLIPDQSKASTEALGEIVGFSRLLRGPNRGGPIGATAVDGDAQTLFWCVRVLREVRFDDRGQFGSRFRFLAGALNLDEAGGLDDCWRI